MKTQKEIRKEIRRFLEGYQISVVFTKRTSYANCYDENIRVADGSGCESIIWSNVFHELQHILCARENIYDEYHNMPRFKHLVNNNRIREIGLEAEIFVDKRAEKHFNKVFPDMTYDQSYRTERDQNWYQGWLDKHFPYEETQIEEEVS